MTKAEYETRREAIRTDRTLSISQAAKALTALTAEYGSVDSGFRYEPAAVAPLTSDQLVQIDAAQRATEAEQARLDKAL